MIYLLGAGVGEDADKVLLMDNVRIDEVKVWGTTGVGSDPIEIVERTTRHDKAVHFNPVRNQQLRQVGSSKSCHARNQRPH
jgi:hypothetical protein